MIFISLLSVVLKFVVFVHKRAKRQVNGNSLTVLYSNFARQSLHSKWRVSRVTAKIWYQKKIATATLAAGGTHSRRVSGKKEIPSAASINFAAGFCRADERRGVRVAADVITFNALDTLGKALSFSLPVSHAAAKTRIESTRVFRESPRAWKSRRRKRPGR